MLFVVVHEVPGRLRARVPGGFSRHLVPTLREALEALPGVTILALNARTGGVLCRYADTAARAALLQTLGRPKEARRTAVLPVGRPQVEHFEREFPEGLQLDRRPVAAPERRSDG